MKALNSQFLAAAVLSALVGLGGGVIGTALTSDHLSDYALTLRQFSSPARLSEERPRSAPQTYAEALRRVTDSVLPGVASFYPSGSYAAALASGAVMTSDGWLVTLPPAGVSLASATVVIGTEAYPVERVVSDPATDALFVKVAASNLPVFAFGSGFDMLPGDELFAATGGSSIFFETVVESRWSAGPLSSDVPQRRLAVADPLLGAYVGAPVVNVRGELVGLVSGGGSGYTTILPTDGVLSAFAAILKEGAVVRASLGVSSTDLSRTRGLGQADTHGLDRGALLLGAASVKKGGAAAIAGLVPGDVVLSVDGVAVDARRSLDELVVTHAPGDTVTLRVTDGVREREVRVVLGAL